MCEPSRPGVSVGGVAALAAAVLTAAAAAGLAVVIAAWAPLILTAGGLLAAGGCVLVVRELRASGPMWRPVDVEDQDQDQRPAVKARRPVRAIEGPRPVLPGAVIEDQAPAVDAGPIHAAWADMLAAREAARRGRHRAGGA